MCSNRIAFIRKYDVQTPLFDVAKENDDWTLREITTGWSTIDTYEYMSEHMGYSGHDFCTSYLDEEEV